MAEHQFVRKKLGGFCKITEETQKLTGFFVTGTDTGVGKTVASAFLMSRLRQTLGVCYWKPIQTGIEEENDTQTVRDLAKLSDEEVFDKGYRLEKPFSPHLSAKLANVKITTDKVLAVLQKADRKRFYIVEGAGGIFVPLNENEMIFDLIKILELPVIIVSRSGLGTINHTCLTINALRSHNLNIFGVIMNGVPNAENKKAIEHYGKVKVLSEIPQVADVFMDFAQISETRFEKE